MPVPREIPGTPQAWLARAKGNLVLARVEKPEGAFWEDLCYNAQQASEKALKAVLQYKAISFRYVHDLEELITALDQNGINVPEIVKEAVTLTPYAIETRYPGDFEPVTEQEYRQALETAEYVLAWAESIVNEENPA